MATIKQKKALNKIVENRGNIGKAMLEAGYDENTAKNPKNLTESKGYKELLKESGLTENLVVRALVEDIKKKPKNRIQELGLGARLLGMIKKTPFIEINEENPLTIELINYSDYAKNKELAKIADGKE